MCYSAIVVANAFIDIAENEGSRLTNLALQKIVYLAHGWYYAITGTPLVAEDFQAWEYGPVVPCLYYELRKFGAGSVDKKIPSSFCVPNPSEDFDFLKAVYNKYGRYTAVQLVSLTHKPDSPWKKAWDISHRNSVINHNEIREYFNKFLVPENAAKESK